MTVRCVDCVFFSLRDARQMALHGFGNCQRAGRPHTFFGANAYRTCPRYQAADRATTQARQDWLQAQRKKFRSELGL